MYIPDGYGTLFPYMIVDDAERFLAFLGNAFGAEEIGRTALPGRPIANARIRIGTSSFMVTEADGESLQPMPGAYYLYVDDVDQVFERALAAGATAVFEPADMPYEDRQAGITDRCGNLWWISRRLVEHSYDD